MVTDMLFQGVVVESRIHISALQFAYLLFAS